MELSWRTTSCENTKELDNNGIMEHDVTVKGRDCDGLTRDLSMNGSVTNDLIGKLIQYILCKFFEESYNILQSHRSGIVFRSKIACRLHFLHLFSQKISTFALNSQNKIDPLFYRFALKLG